MVFTVVAFVALLGSATVAGNSANQGANPRKWQRTQRVAAGKMETFMIVYHVR